MGATWTGPKREPMSKFIETCTGYPCSGCDCCQPEQDEFVAYVNGLHVDKHQAYGDSWKRRGEMLGIMANIARKIDRLGTNSSDETSTDTAIDLLVYLAKYRWWLVDYRAAAMPIAYASYAGMTYSDHTDPVHQLLLRLAGHTCEAATDQELELYLTELFTVLEPLVMKDAPERVYIVEDMLAKAFQLARQRWSA